MGGLVAAVAVIAIFLGLLLTVVFDAFCLLRLWAAGNAPFAPKAAWAVLIVCTSPLGGLLYLLARRGPQRSPDPVATRARPLLGGKAWFGPAAGRGRSPASAKGHAVGAVAIAMAGYLFAAGQLWAAALVVLALVITVFLKATSPHSGTVTLYSRDGTRR